MADNEASTSGVGSSRLATTLLALNTLLLAAVLGLTLRSMSTKPVSAAAAPLTAEHREGAEAPAAGGHEPAEGGGGADAATKTPTVKMSEFVVQLRDDRYARFAFDLEVRNDSDVATLTQLLPRVRESFLSYLSDRSLDEVRGSEGTERVKRELLQRIEAVYPGKHVKAVILSDFVTQSQ
jgi:flagellar FliL protein